MKKFGLLCFFLFIVVSALYSQEEVSEQCKLQCGISTNLILDNSGLSISLVTPNLKIVREEDNYWTEEEEKNPEKFKKFNFSLEFLLFPYQQYSMVGNVHYRLCKYRRWSIQGIGGIMFFFQPSELADFKAGYMLRFGLLTQINLGLIAPFASISSDGSYTIGSIFDLKAVRINPKNRYHLHLKKEQF